MKRQRPGMGTASGNMIMGRMCGEKIIITKAGKLVALQSPIEDALERRTPENDAGIVTIAPDFDAPLPEFDL